MFLDLFVYISLYKPVAIFNLSIYIPVTRFACNVFLLSLPLYSFSCSAYNLSLALYPPLDLLVYFIYLIMFTFNLLSL